MPGYVGGRAARGELLSSIVELMKSPMGCEDVINATGIPRSSVGTYVKELHDAKRIHVADWRIEKFKTVALYIAGKGKDAPRPQRPRKIMTDDELEQKIFRRKPVVVSVVRDPLVAALFGEASTEERKAA